MSDTLAINAPTTVWPGDLNAVSAAILRQELKALVVGGCRDLIVDLARVRNIDAIGLSVLCATYNSLKREEGALSIINASPDICTLFLRTGLSQHFTVNP